MTENRFLKWMDNIMTPDYERDLEWLEKKRKSIKTVAIISAAIVFILAIYSTLSTCIRAATLKIGDTNDILLFMVEVGLVVALWVGYFALNIAFGMRLGELTTMYLIKKNDKKR